MSDAGSAGRERRRAPRCGSRHALLLVASAWGKEASLLSLVSLAPHGGDTQLARAILSVIRRSVAKTLGMPEGELMDRVPARAR